MSANRKLQSEVDKVMKKIEEGVEVFDEIWDKVYAAPQQSLKEKYESDLKKEIKKLQRLRDQIKTWSSSNDIKDKTELVNAKKLIESKMEKFKICEKETKTKAFSKEGLARDEKLDPHEIEKQKSREWVQAIIERIENFVESWEADIERISAAKGKSKNKEQLLRLDSKVSKNRWHVNMLEQINRLIDNDSLEVEKLNDIQEDIDYFVECMENDDCDGLDDDYNIYEDLQLDSLVGSNARLGLSSTSDKDKDSDAGSDVSNVSSNTKAAATITASGTATVGGVAIGKKVVVPNSSNSAAASTTISPTKATKTSKAATKVSTKTAASVVASAATSTVSSSEGATSSWANTAKLSTAPPTPPATVVPTPTVLPNTTKPSASEPSSTSTAYSSSNGNSKGNGKTVSSKEMATSAAAVTSKPLTQPATLPVDRVIGVHHPPSPSPSSTDDSSSNTGNTQTSSADVLSRNNTTSSIVGGATKDTQLEQQQQSQAAPFMQQFSSQQTTSINQQHQQSGDLSSFPLSGSTELNNGGGNKTQQSPMFGNSQEMQSISNLLKMSMMHAPPSNDVPNDHRQRGFTPRNPYNSHPSFPTQQPAVFENPAIFERLPIDSLFLAFYYQQGTYQQYLAARQLKKNSWRFHKKYMTWFQRHEEPKVTTDEYEEGTYVYFDYESGWCQRIKSEFKFEYCYLEDELNQPQNP